MEENKYICPKCGAEMIAVYKKPALNLSCPKCGCKIATSKWEDIDLDDTDYEIILESVLNPSIEQIKCISKLTALNFIASKKFIEKGGELLKAKAIELKEKIEILNKASLKYSVSPEFPY